MSILFSPEAAWSGRLAACPPASPPPILAPPPPARSCSPRARRRSTPPSAAALVLYVVEPQSCGLGGDAFLIHVEPGRDPVALDGSGALPRALDDAALAAAGLDTIPARGAASATVPGAMRLLEDALAPSSARARWPSSRSRRSRSPATDSRCVRRSPPPPRAPPPRSATTRCSGRSTCPDGRRSRPATRSSTRCSPSACRRSARRASTLLHEGELGTAVVARLRDGGGFLTRTTSPPTHAATDATSCRRRSVAAPCGSCPPPTQGIAVIHALDADRGELDAVESPDDWRRVIEVMGGAMAGAGFDLSQIGARPRRRQGRHDVHRRHRSPTGAGVADHEPVRRLRRPPRHPRAGRADRQPGHDAARVAAADDAGAQAAAHHDPGRGHARRRLQFVLGVAGGFMQPQAQVQILIHMLERGLAPQAAIDEPRFRIGFGGALSLEPGHPLCECDAGGRGPTARPGGLRRRPGGRRRRTTATSPPAPTHAAAARADTCSVR